MSRMALVDSNILVYFVDRTEPEKHEKAKKFLSFIANNPEKFVVATQNLRELSSVVVKKKLASNEELQEYLNILEESFQKILKDDLLDIKDTCRLAISKKASFWDCLLVSTMARNSIREIYTEDINDFKSLGVKTTNPLAEE